MRLGLGVALTGRHGAKLAAGLSTLLAEGKLSPLLTHQRSQVNTRATLLDSAGYMGMVGADQLRVNGGVIVGHNHIRNPRFEGGGDGVLGAGGAMPSFMALSGAVGVAVERVGKVVVNGVPCLRLRFFGTATGATNLSLVAEASGVIGASAAQVWAHSVMARLVTSVGAVSNPALRFITHNTAGSQLIAYTGPTLLLDGTLRRFSQSFTANEGATSSVRPLLSFPILNGQTYDFTVDIGAPQMELGNVPGEVSLPPAGVPGPSVAYGLSPGGRALLEAGTTNFKRQAGNDGALLGEIGAGGALPNNISVGGLPAGMTLEVVWIGTENGMPSWDLRITGVPGSSPLQINTEGANPAASPGQTWTYALHTRVASGSLVNISSANLALALGSGQATPLYTPTSAPLAQNRQQATQLAPAGTTNALGRWRLNFANTSTAVDITIRFGPVQLEIAAQATTQVFALANTFAASTRGADRLFAIAPAWMRADAGTLVMRDMLLAASPVASARIAQVRGSAGALDLYVSGTLGFQTPAALLTRPLPTFDGATPFSAAFTWDAAANRAALVTRRGATRDAVVSGALGTLGSIARLDFANRLEGDRALGCEIGAIRYADWSMSDAELASMI